MTTPAILFDDVPKIHYWGSTAPYELSHDDDDERGQEEAQDAHLDPDGIMDQNHVDVESSSGDGAENDRGDRDSDETDYDVMETIYADPSLEFEMIPANIYGENKDCSPPLNTERNASFATRHSPSTRNDDCKDSMFQAFLKRCGSYMESEDSRLQQDKKQSYFKGTSSRSAPSRVSTIYSSYDWVSEVVVDEQGRRLILPGQLVAMDSDSANQQESSPNFGSGLPHSPAETDSDIPTVALLTRADFSSLFETSTIMVSAHDLLATQHNISDDGESDFENIPSYSPPPSLSIPGYHTATMSSKIGRALRRFAFQKMQLAQHNLIHTTSSLTSGVASQLQKAERRLHILATVSDLAVQGCDWLFPTPLRQLEEGTEPPEDPIGDVYVSIEMAILEGVEAPSSHREELSVLLDTNHQSG